MPRQVRDAPPPKRLAGQRVFGRRWPLPISPVQVGLVLALVLAVGAAWYFEGRYKVTPAAAAKRVIPYQASDIQSVRLTTADGSATYMRDSNGKFALNGVAPTATPTPAPEATPAPVSLTPGTKVESAVSQLAGMTVERVVSPQPSTSADYGLDQPQLTLTFTPKSGAPDTLAVGKLNPDQTEYYVVRGDKKDTVLVSRYVVDDVIKIAGDVIKAQSG